MPNRPKFRSIKTKSLARLFAISFFFIIILISLIAYGSYASELHQNRDSTIRNAEDLTRSIDLLFEHSRKNVETIASLGDVKDFILSSYDLEDKIDIEDNDYLDDKEYIRSELEEFNLGNQYKSIYIMDRTGFVLVSTDKSFEDKNFSYRDYFNKAINGKEAVDAVIGSVSNELGFFFAAPVYGDNGEVIAAIIAKFAPDRVYQLLEEEAKFSKGEVFLISKNQQIIFSNDENHVFKFLKTPNAESIKKLKIKEESIEIADEKIIPFSEKIDSFKETTFFNLKSIPEKNFVIAKSLDQMFFIVISQDISIILEQPKRLAVISSLLIISMSFFLMLGFYFLIKYLVKPIESLKTAANKIANNHWDFSLDFGQRNDEFGQLAESFDQMAKQIKENHENLNLEVKKKTADLQEKISQLEKMTGMMADRELKMIELKKQLGFKDEEKGDPSES